MGFLEVRISTEEGKVVCLIGLWYIINRVQLPVLSTCYNHFVPIIVGVGKRGAYYLVQSGGDGGPTIYGCMTWPPRRDHYRLLRRTHHRLLLRVIGYRRERGTYRQLSYAQALKKTGC